MTYESGKRTQIMNFIKTAINTAPIFNGRVKLEYPDSPMPSGSTLPEVFIGRGVENMDGGTTEENRGEFAFHVIVFVERQPKQPIELLKCEIQDIIESKLLALNVDTNFRAVATQLFIDTADAGTMAVTRLGYTGGTYPPYGAIRIDGRVEYYFVVI